MKPINEKVTGDEKVAGDKSGTDDRAGAHLTYTNYTGTTGLSRHITRREYGFVPLAVVSKYQGMMGENPHDHYEGSMAATARWTEFLDDIRTNGISHPIFVNVDYDKDPMINEGNHRLEAARILGLEKVPVEVAYYGHAEDQGTIIDRYLASI